MDVDASRKAKFTRIILAYPIALILLGILANLLLFGVTPAIIAIPEPAVVIALSISAVLLLGNHTWLMTSTELTRLKYNMHATPEEWAASNHVPEDVSAKGLQELERRHNAHRNTTENVVYFVILAALVSIVSPVVLAAQVWVLGFAAGRIGHSFSYLAGFDGLRGISMSISLVSLYGLASYLAISWII
ncbi:MAPEG family protein [Loktanella sp. Alg231-35]|uniref:MAPEG family protein n=1 Tax=Loktanella sp. Alg231-35 TaxID=1922220 RepID=UPI000D557C6A|nr:MAPEG family protein [Loktanella sp. Alg231-35]